MGWTSQEAKDKEKREIKEFIELSQSSLGELELTYKKKWHAVKDFNHSVGEVKSFTNWVNNIYKKEKSSLNLKIKNAIKKHDQL